MTFEEAHTPSGNNLLAFRVWFGNSKVLDSQGRPLVVHHGTHRDFSAFCADAAPANPYLWGDHALGFFFTPYPGRRSDSGPWSGAAGFAGTAQVDGGDLRSRRREYHTGVPELTESDLSA